MNYVEIYKKIKPSVVALGTKTQMGKKVDFSINSSAFCVDPSGIFVTAKHCIVDEEDIGSINDIKNLNVIIPSYNIKGGYAILSASPEVILGSEEYDLAVIKVINDNDFKFPYSPIVGQRQLFEGEWIGCSGFPLSHDTNTVFQSLFKGIISRLDRTYNKDKDAFYLTNITIDASLHPGNSGGPIFDSNGEIIAVVSFQEWRDLSEYKWPVREKGDEKIHDIVDSKYVWTNMINCAPARYALDMIKDIKDGNY